MCWAWCADLLLLWPHPTTHLLLQPKQPAGVAQASASAVAQAVYEALTCNCACEQPTAEVLAQAAAKANGGGCGGVATALAGRCVVVLSSMCADTSAVVRTACCQHTVLHAMLVLSNPHAHPHHTTVLRIVAVLACRRPGHCCWQGLRPSCCIRRGRGISRPWQVLFIMWRTTSS